LAPYWRGDIGMEGGRHGAAECRDTGAGRRWTAEVLECGSVCGETARSWTARVL